MKLDRIAEEHPDLLPKVQALTEYQIACAFGPSGLINLQEYNLGLATPNPQAEVKGQLLAVPNHNRMQLLASDPLNPQKACLASGCGQVFVTQGDLLKHVSDHSAHLSHMSRYYVCPLPESLQYQDHIQKPCGYSRLCHGTRQSQDGSGTLVHKRRLDELATHLRNVHKLSKNQAINVTHRMENNSAWAAALIQEYH
ncbi:hypothetical protein ACHAQH_005543 [Verticillium albo-atrum]